MIARYVDSQGRPLRQIELCERHARELAGSGIAVRDMEMKRAEVRQQRGLTVTSAALCRRVGFPTLPPRKPYHQTRRAGTA